MIKIPFLTFVIFRATALEQLQQLACSPSVPMQDVPRETLGQHLGFGRDEEEGRDELDERVARQYFLTSKHLIQLTVFLLKKKKLYLEHTRYVYKMQDTDTTTEDSEGSDSWDSDESSSSQNNWRRGPYRSSSASRINGRYTQQHQHQYTSTAERKRMSLITGKYYDIPIHENGFSHFDGSTSIGKQPTKRRFFPDGPGKFDDVGICVVDASVNARIVGRNMVGAEGFGNRYGHVMVPEFARIMERGGGGGVGGGGGLDGYGEDGEPDEGEDEDEDVPMST